MVEVFVGVIGVAVRVAGGRGVKVRVGVRVMVKVRVGVNVRVTVLVGVGVSVPVGSRKPVELGRGVAEGCNVPVMAKPGSLVGVQVAGRRYCGVNVWVGRTSKAGMVGGGNGFRLL